MLKTPYGVFCYSKRMNQIDWNDKQKEYKTSDWAYKPSLFAEFAVTYFPETGLLLELGAGIGQDSTYFAEKGFEVTATDKTTDSLYSTFQHPDNLTKQLVNVEKLDLNEKFNFSEDTFDIVYAHLSLHYFDEVTTRQIFSEIFRVLKPGGVLAFFTNSVNDPEYNTGIRLEKDYFSTEGDKKRYFNVDSAKDFASAFSPIVADEQGETYKDMAKGVHNLIRFIGTKPDLS